MRKFKLLYLFVLIVALSFASCVKDLDVTPIDPSQSTPSILFKNEAAYKQALAKIYASYAVSSQGGSDGGDIRGIDVNFGNYLRQLWGLQELSTDEAIMAWDDATIKNFHWQTWAPNDVFISALYSRIYFSISVANEFIRQADAAKGITGIDKMKAEARFLRAFSYYHALDMFGNVPFVTEKDLPGSFNPKQISRTDLFTYIESELTDIEGTLGDPRFEYGRADKAADWMLLAKLYLNAEVYTGTARYTDAITVINKVIGAGYTLDTKYQNIFLGDNNTSPEMIFPICFDGQNTQQYGGMTFIQHMSVGGDMPKYGHDGGWGGGRTIKTFVEGVFGITKSNFTTVQPTFADSRALFYFDTNPDKGWSWDITNVGTFTHGIGVTKYRNISKTGGAAPNAHPAFVSIDFPVFRLSDAYLMYAEAVVRGGSGGNAATALNYVNALRTRAYGNASGNIAAAGLTLDFLLNERGRELYWEAQRRTDLIRFGKFTGNAYIWEWKGNTQAGAATPSYRDLYPIPANDINANPNLKQNTGY
jgi:starch-binding outer membrane protein, SusD/RagB family